MKIECVVNFFTEIVEQVRARTLPLCRPVIQPDMTDIGPSVTKLMSMCWDADPLCRPTFNTVIDYIKKNIQQGKYVAI